MSFSFIDGRLADFGFIELVQTLALGKKSARVDFERNGAVGCLSFDEGCITFASLPPFRGESAFYELAAWTNGTFRIGPWIALPQNVWTSNDSLVLEALRRLDER